MFAPSYFTPSYFSPRFFPPGFIVLPEESAAFILSGVAAGTHIRVVTKSNYKPEIISLENKPLPWLRHLQRRQRMDLKGTVLRNSAGRITIAVYGSVFGYVVDYGTIRSATVWLTEATVPPGTTFGARPSGQRGRGLAVLGPPQPGVYTYVFVA